MNYPTLLNYCLTNPKRVYQILGLMAIIALAMFPSIQIDTDPENMLKQDNPARVFHNQVKADFAMHDMIVVGAISQDSLFNVEKLNALHKLSNYILTLDGVIKADVLALSEVDNISQAGPGTIAFSYLMKQAPTTKQQAEFIKQAIKRLPMLNNTLVSNDEHAALIYIPVSDKNLSYQLAEQIRAYSQTLTTSLDYHITGLPVAEDQFGYEMFVQMGIAAPLAGLAIFVLLWFFFRNIALITAPMIAAMATVVIIMGGLIGAGFTVHIMSSMIAIFLMPIAVVDSVHILSEFADRYKQGDDPKQVVTKVMQHLFTPMLYTSITSAIGFYSLLLTPIPPVKVFGFFIGTGILLAFVLTITFIPAYISSLKPATLAKLHDALVRLNERSVLASSLQKLGGFATKRTKLVMICFSALIVFSAIGISKITIDDNPVNWFKQDHPIRIADKILNHHFAGSYDAWVVFDSPKNATQNDASYTTFNKTLNNLPAALRLTINDALNESNHQLTPAVLAVIDDLSFAASDDNQAALNQLYNLAEQIQSAGQIFLQPQVLRWLAKLQKDMQQTGFIGKSNGLTDIVRTVNRELISGNEQDFVIPASQNGVAQTLLQYQSSHRPQDLWHFVSKDYQRSLLWIQMTSGNNQHTSKIVEWLDQYVLDNPPPTALNVNWAGKSYLNVVWQNAMVSGMMDSLMSSFVVVFLMMVILFRSLKYGLLAMLPLSFTISLIYGLIGWVGKAYDMPIAVLSALTLGLSIDFAIHFLQRCKELEKETGSLSTALMQMFDEPARAISRNAIVIAVGFTPLLLSPLMPYVTVGFFLATIMATSALVTLVLLPSLQTLTQNKSTTIDQMEEPQ